MTDMGSVYTLGGIPADVGYVSSAAEQGHSHGGGIGPVTVRRSRQCALSAQRAVA
jgi:hypothetical protein